jgi:hypothetical protein
LPGRIDRHLALSKNTDSKWDIWRSDSLSSDQAQLF